MKTGKHVLLYINGIVWAIAGANILRIGLGSIYTEGSLKVLWFLGTALFFAAIFTMVVKKNFARIKAMKEDKIPLYKFMNLPGYLIIIFMMTLGITLRASGKIQESFFAFFYTGLGLMLTLAGIVYLYLGFSRRKTL